MRTILLSGLDDWVSLDELLSRTTSPQAAIALIRELLERDLMRAGKLGESGFEPREAPVEEIVTEIEQACVAFDWRPQGGSGWWFANTDQGTHLATTGRQGHRPRPGT
ncbi:MAG: hypothetical protein HOZ81_29240 [Streptomyces sp.]|nr:hypothetical protein [Streptomyces sp.]NUR88655.1 hypothetical protein [Nonomuraea sp.]